MLYSKLRFIPIVALVMMLAGCATFRSNIEGSYTGQDDKNFGAEKVSVLFVFSHYKQAKGFDAIPKLESRRQVIDDFDDLFIDAKSELSNIGKYSTFTNFASDVGDSKRRHELDSLISMHDYIMRIKFNRENSFVQHFLGAVSSTVSATILPMPYSMDYSMSVDVYNADDILIKSYSREASLTKWVEMLLIFIYPFHTEQRKKEEIYIEFMHDVFREIEGKRVLETI